MMGSLGLDAPARIVVSASRSHGCRPCIRVEPLLGRAASCRTEPALIGLSPFMTRSQLGNHTLHVIPRLHQELRCTCILTDRLSCAIEFIHLLGSLSDH